MQIDADYKKGEKDRMKILVTGGAGFIGQIYAMNCDQSQRAMRLLPVICITQTGMIT